MALIRATVLVFFIKIYINLLGYIYGIPSCLFIFAECCQKRISDIVWNNHKQRTRKSINVAISPYLIQEGLMGGDRTNEKYTDLLENYKKLDLIVRSVPKCGKDDYLVRFIACLRNSSEEDGGMGSHVELADSMEAEYRSLMERAELSESYRNR